MNSAEMKVWLAEFSERFWAKVGVRGPHDCWPWLGIYGSSEESYGTVRVGHQTTRSHVVALSLAESAPVAGMIACHHCDNSRCCNPLHLYWGTQRENMRDAQTRGRYASLTGDRNPSRLYPESRPRGDAHFSRLHPERLCRGTASPHAKLTEETVLLIRMLPGSHAELGRRFGVSNVTIRLIRERKTWRHLTAALPAKDPS